MASRILASEDGGTGRRADAHSIEVVEPRALSRQPLHARGAVIVIKWITLGYPLLVGHEWHGSIHRTHIVNEEDDDVGFFRGLASRYRSEQ